jgi:uncharacterized protein YjbI with pentapeptide repeats
MKFQGQEYEAETFRDIDLTGISFKGSKFVDCNFENCNLSNVNLNGTKFKDVRFRECKILGLDFSKCNDFMLGIGFEYSFLSYSVFSDMNLENTGFVNCQIYDCDFLNTNLKNANFEGSDLKNSLFRNTNLSFTSFRNAKNYNIDPNNNFLKKTKFSIPEVISLLNVYDIELE